MTFLLRLRLPCWARMVLALACACLLGLGAATAGASTPADDAEFERKAAEPLDRGFVAEVVGEPAASPLLGEALEKRTHDVGLLLRCPVCQGSSVSDSPSSTAINMKNEVRDLMAAGYDEAQVLDYFEAAYGQFVLMKPKAEGFNLLVWIGPGILLLAGFGMVVATVRKKGGGTQESAAVSSRVPGRGDLPADAELAGYVRRVRELAYGWPGGAPPAGSSDEVGGGV